MKAEQLALELSYYPQSDVPESQNIFRSFLLGEYPCPLYGAKPLNRPKKIGDVTWFPSKVKHPFAHVGEAERFSALAISSVIAAIVHNSHDVSDADFYLSRFSDVHSNPYAHAPVNINEALRHVGAAFSKGHCRSFAGAAYVSARVADDNRLIFDFGYYLSSPIGISDLSPEAKATLFAKTPRIAIHVEFGYCDAKSGHLLDREASWFGLASDGHIVYLSNYCGLKNIPDVLVAPWVLWNSFNPTVPSKIFTETKDHVRDFVGENLKVGFYSFKIKDSSKVCSLASPLVRSPVYYNKILGYSKMPESFGYSPISLECDLLLSETKQDLMNHLITNSLGIIWTSNEVPANQVGNNSVANYPNVLAAELRNRYESCGLGLGLPIGFWKTVYNTIDLVIGNYAAGIEKVTIDADRSADDIITSCWLTATRCALGIVCLSVSAALYFDDTNVASHIHDKFADLFSSDEAKSKIYSISPLFHKLEVLLESDVFDKIPATKKWRFAIDLCVSELTDVDKSASFDLGLRYNGKYCYSVLSSFVPSWRGTVIGNNYSYLNHMNEVGDCLDMAKFCEDAEEDWKSKIDMRKTKSITDFHNGLVPIFNSIKHKPVPIPRHFTSFLGGKQVQIPGTDLEIVVPSDTNEIRTWGLTQNHCIGTYADRMVDGKTCLLGVKRVDSVDWIGHLQTDMVCVDMEHYVDSPNLIYQTARGIFQNTTLPTTYSRDSELGLCASCFVPWSMQMGYSGTKYYPFGLTEAQLLNSNLDAFVTKKLGPYLARKDLSVSTSNQRGRKTKDIKVVHKSYLISQFYGARNSLVDQKVKEAVCQFLIDAAFIHFYGRDFCDKLVSAVEDSNSATRIDKVMRRVGTRMVARNQFAPV